MYIWFLPSFGLPQVWSGTEPLISDEWATFEDLITMIFNIARRVYGIRSVLITRHLRTWCTIPLQISVKSFSTVLESLIPFIGEKTPLDIYFWRLKNWCVSNCTWRDFWARSLCWSIMRSLSIEFLFSISSSISLLRYRFALYGSLFAISIYLRIHSSCKKMSERRCRVLFCPAPSISRIISDPTMLPAVFVSGSCFLEGKFLWIYARLPFVSSRPESNSKRSSNCLACAEVLSSL